MAGGLQETPSCYVLSDFCLAHYGACEQRRKKLYPCSVGSPVLPIAPSCTAGYGSAKSTKHRDAPWSEHRVFGLRSRAQGPSQLQTAAMPSAASKQQSGTWASRTASVPPRLATQPHCCNNYSLAATLKDSTVHHHPGNCTACEPHHALPSRPQNSAHLSCWTVDAQKPQDQTPPDFDNREIRHEATLHMASPNGGSIMAEARKLQHRRREQSSDPNVRIPCNLRHQTRALHTTLHYLQLPTTIQPVFYHHGNVW